MSRGVYQLVRPLKHMTTTTLPQMLLNNSSFPTTLKSIYI